MTQNDQSAEKRIVKKAKRKNLIYFLGLLLILGAGVVIGSLVYIAADLPAWNPQQLTGDNATLLYDDEGKICSRLHAEENRTEVNLDKVPDELVKAFIATEDKDFYQHHGVNFKGIARAAVRNVQSRDLTGQGASTITQQLARNAFLSFDKAWERKIKEIFLAFKLESIYSKDEILAMYLNKIYFGAGAYGVQAAANTYFGKDVSELSLAESSMLAGLVQSPNNYDPFQHLDRARARQKIVLQSMVDCDFIDQSTADQAYNTELLLVKGQNSGKRYGYYVDAVIDEAIRVLSGTKSIKDVENTIYRGGLRIYTSMNTALQSHAEDYFQNPAHFPNQPRDGKPIQVGMVIIEHSSGDVKAVMGGREYEQQRGFNRATAAYRQPGSSIKPLTVYSPALELGIMPNTVLDDSPISYKLSSGQVWSPKNYDGSYRGLITMRTGVQWSVNTFAVQLLDQIGIRKGYEFGKALGLNLVDTPGRNDLGLAPLSLGGLTKGATPLQMSAAYGAIGNGGIYIQPHLIEKIVDNKGITLYEFKPQLNRVMSRETAWLMTNLLQTVTSSGTGTAGKVPGVPTAGKTGTSEELTDAWFCGFTPVYSGAVWMGYDNQKYKMNNVFGGGYPAALFRSMMQQAHKNTKAGAWPMPGNIVSVAVCSKSGKLPGENCPQDQIISEYSLKGNLPTETCDLHQYVVICKESGKLAGRYCPETETVSGVKTSENSAEKTKIPTEKCDIHTDFSIPGLFKTTVKVCRDPRNEGELYKAITPGPGHSGGCPQEYIEEIVIPPGEKLPSCPLEDHQVKKKKAQEYF